MILSNWIIAWTAATMTAFAVIGLSMVGARVYRKKLEVVGQDENVIYVKAVPHRNSA